MSRGVGLALRVVLVASLSGCVYAHLLRPSGLKPLNPDVARLVNTLPSVDRPNEAIIARLIRYGGHARARERAAGVFRASIHIPVGPFI